LARQHGQGVAVVAGDGDAPDGFEHTHSDFAMVNQFGDVG
jgi:hypothetical protein